MREITVDRDKLLATLCDNRDKHKITYDGLMAAYQEAVIEWHEDQVLLIRQGRTPVRMVPGRLPEPEDHTDDYDQAISMLRWETADTVQVDEHDFEKFILDQWGWSRRLAETSMSYNNR